MRLKFRNHTHDLNENMLAVGVESRRHDMHAQRGRHESGQIQSKLIGSSQSDLVSKVAALKAAYAGSLTGDATFSYNDGTVVHRILNSTALGGVRVVRGPEFPEDLRA